jgi:hypothetical protein
VAERPDQQEHRADVAERGPAAAGQVQQAVDRGHSHDGGQHEYQSRGPDAAVVRERDVIELVALGVGAFVRVEHGRRHAGERASDQPDAGGEPASADRFGQDGHG